MEISAPSNEVFCEFMYCLGNLQYKMLQNIFCNFTCVYS